MKKLSSLLKDLLKVAPKFLQKDMCEVPTTVWRTSPYKAEACEQSKT